MYYTPGHFFCKSATGCLVHHYSQFDGNYTLENLYGHSVWGTRSFFLQGEAAKVHEQLMISYTDFHYIVFTPLKSTGWLSDHDSTLLFSLGNRILGMSCIWMACHSKTFIDKTRGWRIRILPDYAKGGKSYSNSEF